MHLAVMATAQGDRELIAHFAAKRPWLRKSQMMGICRLTAADEAWLLGHQSHVIAVANPARRRQCQHAFICHRGLSPCSIRMRKWRFSVLQHQGTICSIDRKNRQSRLESLLNALSIGCGQSVFGAKNLLSPVGRSLGRRNLLEIDQKLIAQGGRRPRLEDWLGRI